MRLTYTKGNIINASEPIIAHGCNAQGVMGSGVAKAVKLRFPNAFDCYRRQHKEEGLKVGQVIYAPCEEKIIANCITQRYYGRDGRRYVDYEAFRKCMKSIDAFTTAMKVNTYKDETITVAMPRIGAGLGGGDWSKIEAIILEESHNFETVIYDLE